MATHESPLPARALALRPLARPHPSITRFPIEHLPKSLLCIPLVAQWLWLALRHRSLTLPSTINPAIETGGLAGESKSAVLAQITPDFAPAVAPWHMVHPGGDPVALREAANLAYPLIAKPDIGWSGYGVQLIEDDAALQAYAAAFPPEARFIIQHLVQAPNEAGLFYVRPPGAPHGRLLGLTLRHTPHVTGDGTSTIAALIAANPRTRRNTHIYAQTSASLARIPAEGERVTLTTIASLRVGARYQDATSHITPALDARIDAIARSMPHFHLGRFDVRFTTMSALRHGEFQIIEVNGAGSEAIHLWDPALPLRTAFAGIFAKQRLLFQLGAQMRARGTSPVGPMALARAWLHQQRLIARYPASN